MLLEEVPANMQHQHKNSRRCLDEGDLLAVLHQHINVGLVMDRLQERTVRFLSTQYLPTIEGTNVQNEKCDGVG